MGLDRDTGAGLAPDSLGARMTLELHMLDAVSESLLQVTNVERTRAVSLAQHETVALAQILKVSPTFSIEYIFFHNYKSLQLNLVHSLATWCFP